MVNLLMALAGLSHKTHNKGTNYNGPITIKLWRQKYLYSTESYKSKAQRNRNPGGSHKKFNTAESPCCLVFLLFFPKGSFAFKMDFTFFFLLLVPRSLGFCAVHNKVVKPTIYCSKMFIKVT